jgi:hypothetical protein
MSSAGAAGMMRAMSAMITSGVADAVTAAGTAEGGARWERVLAMARDYNSQNYQGRVNAGEVTDTRVRLSVEVMVGDQWTRGARATAPSGATATRAASQ